MSSLPIIWGPVGHGALVGGLASHVLEWSHIVQCHIGAAVPATVAAAHVQVSLGAAGGQLGQNALL